MGKTDSLLPMSFLPDAVGLLNPISNSFFLLLLLLLRYHALQ